MFQETNTARAARKLTREQADALASLPEHKDPFFAVHNALHAIKAAYWCIDKIPLPAHRLVGECGSFSGVALMACRRMFHIPKKDLHLIQLATFINEAHHDTLLDIPNSNLSTLATNGLHQILYVKDGMRFLPGQPEGDIFFDSTSGQFAKNGDSDRTERVFSYLKKHHGKEGKIMADMLHYRGYLKIPAGEEGAERLGIILAAYRGRKFWIPDPFPVNPQDLISSAANETRGSRSERLYRTNASTCLHRNAEWESFENLHAPGVPNGLLELNHPKLIIQYDLSWHENAY